MYDRDHQDVLPGDAGNAVPLQSAAASELVADLRRRLPVGSRFTGVFVGLAGRLIDALVPLLVEARDHGMIDLDRSDLLDALSGPKIMKWAMEERVSAQARNRLLEHLCLDLGCCRNFSASGRRYSGFLEQLGYARMYVVTALDAPASPEAAVG